MQVATTRMYLCFGSIIFFDTSYFFAQLVSSLTAREEGRKQRKEEGKREGQKRQMEGGRKAKREGGGGGGKDRERERSGTANPEWSQNQWLKTSLGSEADLQIITFIHSDKKHSLKHVIHHPHSVFLIIELFRLSMPWRSFRITVSHIFQ